MSRRILITGSREWTDRRMVALALSEHARRGDVLVQGECVFGGADAIAAEMWARFGPVEGHRAADHPSPKARNQYMVDLGADVCLAFALSWASGTGHCARRARAAGIPTYDYGVDTKSRG